MKDMTKGNPLSLILSFALPLLLGNLLQQLYNVADTAIVGKSLGASALAAVGATSSVQFLILGFCIGVCTGFCIPIAQKFGAKNYMVMRMLIFNSAILITVGGVLITAACCLLCPNILRILSTPEDIWRDTYLYILIIFLGIPFTLLYNLTAGILRSIGDSKSPFYILAISTLVNILLDLFCIRVLGWGCAGAALATITSQAISGLACLWIIGHRYEILHLKREELHMDSSLVRSLLFMGLPMGFQFSITAIGSMVMQSANNGLGSLYTSAFTSATRIKMLFMCPVDAIASSVATFCSQNLGAGSYSRIVKGYKIGALIGAAYGVVSGIFLFFFGRYTLLLFYSPSEVQILEASNKLLVINSTLLVVLALLNVTRITVQGLGFSERAIFSGVMEMITRTALALFLVPRLGFTAICISDPAAWLAADLYIIPTCFYVLKKVRQTLPPEEGDRERRCLRPSQARA